MLTNSRALRRIRAVAGASMALAVLPAAAEPAGGALAPGMPAGGLPALGRDASSGTRPIRWAPCPGDDPLLGALLKGLECGTLEVPLDYQRPTGRQITLALTRARHTDDRHYRGAVLLNRGGPGTYGRDLAATFAKSTAVAAGPVAPTYDWIGFDPRGVGASRPAIMCAVDYHTPSKVRPDTVPRTRKDERAWRARAAAAAADCGSRHPDLLPHMSTMNAARDLDEIRKALGLSRIGYFGYSYGSYLGAVYASLFPDRVHRMVLDSVVRPSAVWYEANLDQDVAFEKRIKAFFRWTATHRRTYRLGRTATAVERIYRSVRKRLAADPIADRVGPVELDEIFLTAGYGSVVWPAIADGLAGYVRRSDKAALRSLLRTPSLLDRNNYAVYLAVECRDAPWPRDWAVWHRDNWALYRAGNRFATWHNAWYNAPCASWPVAGGPAPLVHGPRIGSVTREPSLLLVQAKADAATPYRGAVEMHDRFPRSRLVVAGGGDHGVTQYGNRCVDDHVWAYLGDGTLPASLPGPDVRCAALPAPRPASG